MAKMPKRPGNRVTQAGTNPNIRVPAQLGTPGGLPSESARLTPPLPQSPVAPVPFGEAGSAAAAGLSPYERAEWAASRVRQVFPEPARVAVILGSGLGAFGDTLDDVHYLDYSEIPYFPRPTVPGHAGRLAGGTIDGVRVLCLQGRFHAYEGYDIADVVFPVRVLSRLGVRVLVLTNAAGGISPKLVPGDLMVIDDHLNLTGVNPLRGRNDDRFGPRFPDMSEAYPVRYRQQLFTAAPENMNLKSGVYAALSGPSYETPAEIRMLCALGADAVGMSTVPEAIVANHMGMGVCGISCICNMAAGVIPGTRLTHEEVVGTAARVRDDFIWLLRRAAPRLAAVDPT